MAKETKNKTKSAEDVLAALEAGGMKTVLTEKENKFYSTGNVAIDWALGGGIATGKVFGVNGKSGSGKTTVVMQTFKEQLDNPNSRRLLWVDYERAFDTKYASQIGIDYTSNKFVYLKPTSLEEGCDAIADLVATGDFSMVSLDSIARMTTESELEGEMSDKTVADKAKALYKFMRKVLNSLDDNDTSLIVLNHLLEVINTTGGGYGAPAKTSPGGNAIPYFASQIMEASLLKSIKSPNSDSKFDALDIQFTVTKNRFAPPSRQVVVRNNFGTGFDSTRSLLEVFKEIGLVDASTAWTKILDPKLAQILGKDQYNGYNNFVDAVAENPAALERAYTTAKSVLQTGEIPE